MSRSSFCRSSRENIVRLLELRRWDVANWLQQSHAVEPADPSEGCELHLLVEQRPAHPGGVAAVSSPTTRVPVWLHHLCSTRRIAVPCRVLAMWSSVRSREGAVLLGAVVPRRL